MLLPFYQGRERERDRTLNGANSRVNGDELGRLCWAELSVLYFRRCGDGSLWQQRITAGDAAKIYRMCLSFGQCGCERV